MIRTKPEELIKFHKQLMKNAPKGYVPWYFPIVKDNKAPDGIAISRLGPNSSWKEEHAKLSIDKAVERLQQGLNVGIAARGYDPLILIDIDDYDYLPQMLNTLVVRSRKRCGLHGYCWKHPDCDKLPLNIPTDFGEIRSNEQYVVAPGSYVKTNLAELDKEEMPEEVRNNFKNDPMLGVYTVDSYEEMMVIKFEGLPIFYQEQYNKVKIKESKKALIKNNTFKPTDKDCSALFKLSIEDVVSVGKGRVAHPLHSSDTGMNFSMGNGLAHCWRHLVSLNAIQFLVVKSGYMSCQDAGTGHSGSGAGSSSIEGDDGAIFWAWYEAKKSCIIPKSDPIPVRALWYLARKHNIIDENYNVGSWKLPKKIYNQVLKILEVNY